MEKNEREWQANMRHFKENEVEEVKKIKEFYQNVDTYHQMTVDRKWEDVTYTPIQDLISKTVYELEYRIILKKMKVKYGVSIPNGINESEVEMNGKEKRKQERRPV